MILVKGLAGGRDPDSADYITKQTTTSPGDKGEQLWLDALDTFFCNDKKLIDYVQQIVGLSAIGKVYLEAIIIPYGGASNGKSTFWKTASQGARLLQRSHLSRYTYGWMSQKCKT